MLWAHSEIDGRLDGALCPKRGPGAELVDAHAVVVDAVGSCFHDLANVVDVFMESGTAMPEVPLTARVRTSPISKREARSERVRVSA